MPELRTATVLAFTPRPRRETSLAAEAARRIAETGYPRYARRQLATGLPVPAAVLQRKSQIEFVAAALARLPQLPENFAADHFWPA